MCTAIVNTRTCMLPGLGRVGMQMRHCWQSGANQKTGIKALSPAADADFWLIKAVGAFG